MRSLIHDSGGVWFWVVVLLLQYVGFVSASTTAQHLMLCGIAASTDVRSFYNEWQCANSGQTNNDVCIAGQMWQGVSCANGNVERIDLSALALSGMF